MSNDMQTSLCKGLRACGLPKQMTHELLNVYQQWYDSCGAEWTNDRIKSIRMWYLTYLAGDPQPAPWMRHSSSNLPLNVFGRLFRVRDQAKVLAALSANTLFTEKSLSPRQEEKFRTALQGNKESVKGVSFGDNFLLSQQAFHRRAMARVEERKSEIRVPELDPVTPAHMSGTSIPGRNGKTLRISETDLEHRQIDMRRALLESWRCVPQATIEYLDREDRLDLVPSSYWPIGGAYTNRGPRYANRYPVGRIGLLQKPELKLRSIANPNRVSQHFTRPLAKVWEYGMCQFPSDCTFDQEAGVYWAQQKLAAGVELAGSDLSSATDLLDLDSCLSLAKTWMTPFLSSDSENLSRYAEAVEHFKSLSRGDWVFPAKEYQTVSWKQGQPLGLFPSFRLLAITNNSLGVISALKCGLNPTDSFRVLGDDIIMDARMEDTYVSLVTQLGGIVNREKTLRSAKVAEFGGRIITPTRVMRKAYRWHDPSDTSFMSYVSDLGPQAVGLLRPRQRKQWERFKYVPGIAFNGPWSTDSFGEPLVDRVSWVLLSTHLMDEAPDPDPHYLSLEQQMLLLTWDAADREGRTFDEIYEDLPWDPMEDLQSSQMPAPQMPLKKAGDPRLLKQKGMTTLEVLEKESSSKHFREYIPKALRISNPDDSQSQDPKLETSGGGSGSSADRLLTDSDSLRESSRDGEPEKAPPKAPPVSSRTECAKPGSTRDMSDIDAALSQLDYTGLEDRESGQDNPDVPGYPAL